jgi:DNA helicase HerA-like ATPase
MSESHVDDHDIGRVVSLTGSQVIGLINVESANGTAPLQIGSLVKMQTREATVFGMVNGLSIPIPDQDSLNDEMRIAEMELVGEVPYRANGNARRFRRGVSASPALGDTVFATTVDDIGLIYARPDELAIEIGRVHQDHSLPVYVVIDNLLGKHFAILGTTGSGKSCAVALILHGILEQHLNAHIVLLDPHGEYAHSFRQRAEIIEPNDLQLPYWLFNFDELIEVVFGSEGEQLVQETTLLRDLVQRCKIAFMGDKDIGHTITVDTPTPYKMGDVTRAIDDMLGRLENRGDIAPYQRIKNRLNALQVDRRYGFMFPSSVVVRDNMTAILSRIFRIPVDGKPISILNLSGVPSEILNVVVSVLSRMTFDFAVWSDQNTPILLVCEEAHRYATNNQSEGFEPTRRALSRIAKEGRKYGISLGLISQRPGELATSVLSQCNSIFALRMTNQRDQDIVRAAMSDAGGALLDSLPSLGNAEAVAVGEAVSVPMRLRFSELPADRLPKSATAQFSSNWAKDQTDKDALQAIVERWRSQRR